MSVAPESVQEFRRIVRKRFKRGIDKTVDHVLDGLLVWVVDDALRGEITSTSQAAKVVGDWLSKSFPYHRRVRTARKRSGRAGRVGD